MLSLFLQMSSTPAVFTPLSTSESSADELFLRLYLSSNIAALDNAPKGNLLEERLSTIFSQGTQRSTMTLGRVFSSEHMSSASRWRTSNEFFKRCSNMALPSLDSIQDVSTPSKIIYAVDFSRLPSVELDMFLYAALRVRVFAVQLRRPLTPAGLTLDFSPRPCTTRWDRSPSSSIAARYLSSLPESRKTSPHGSSQLSRSSRTKLQPCVARLSCGRPTVGSSRPSVTSTLWCRRLAVRFYSLVSNGCLRLITLSSAGQGFFDKVVACSSTPALAHHLEVAEDELMLSCSSFNSDICLRLC